MIESLVYTIYVEAAHSEWIFLTPYCVDYIFLWLLEDYVKAKGNAALGENLDVEAVLGVYLKEDQVAV